MAVQLAIDENNDLVFEKGILQLARGEDALRDELRVRLQTHKGEWYLDTRLGLPYRTFVLVRNPNIGLITTILRDAILEQPGINAITSFDVTFDRVSRSLSIVANLTTSAGPVVLTTNPSDIPEDSADAQMPIWLLTILGVTGGIYT